MERMELGMDGGHEAGGSGGAMDNILGYLVKKLNS